MYTFLKRIENEIGLYKKTGGNKLENKAAKTQKSRKDNKIKIKC